MLRMVRSALAWLLVVLAGESAATDCGPANRRTASTQECAADESSLLQVNLLRSDRAQTALIDRLWQGEDLDPETEASDLEALSLYSLGEASQVSAASDVASGSQTVMVMGAFDTGTNLLWALLELNWPDECKRAKNEIVWKHSLSKDPENTFDFINKTHGLASRNVSILAMTRSPLAQFESWKKAPYDLTSCMDRPWQYMDEPCKPSILPTTKQSGGPVHYVSTMAVYNHYMLQHKAMVNHAGFGASALIAYEDLVLSPEVVLNNIAALLGWPVRPRIKILQAPAKTHGNPVGRQAALDKLAHRTWLQDFTAADMQLICNGTTQKMGHMRRKYWKHPVRGINRTTLWGLMEGTYAQDPKPYMYDCLGPSAP